MVPRHEMVGMLAADRTNRLQKLNDTHHLFMTRFRPEFRSRRFEFGFQENRGDVVNCFDLICERYLRTGDN